MPTHLPLLTIAALGVSALAAASTGDDRELAREIGDRVPGKPMECVDPSWAGSPQIIGDRILLYHVTGGVLRNDLPENCPGLDRDAIIVNEVHGGSRLCRGDLFYTIDRDSHIPGPHCVLGSFTPYRKAR